MRFLIVSAVLACAAAAPSNLIAPLAYGGLPALSAYPGLPVPVVQAVPSLTPVAYSAAVPTLSPGDVQAAVIDAQVKAQDLAIAEVDKARALLEQNSEVISEKVLTGNDQIKENNEEAFWAAQDKQWQALDAVKTAEAEIQGAVASNAPELAKSVVAGVAPISPVVYTPGVVTPEVVTPGVVTPVVKAVEVEAKPEEKKEETIEEKKEEKMEEKKVEEIKEEKKEEAAPKAAEPAEEKESAASTLAPVVASLPLSYPVVGPVPRFAPYLAYNGYPSLAYPYIVRSVW